MRLRRAARALVGLGAFVMAADVGAASSPLDAELEAIVTDPAAPLASLSVLAVRGGEVVYQRDFRNQGVRSGTDPLIYRVASISKLVTALGVMRLVEGGVLDLDRDVGEYLGYRLRNPHFPDARITLRMLLAHTSSLRDDGGYFWPEGVKIREVLLPGGKLHGGGAMWASNAPPGAWFAYANLPWGVIGTVMEKATGERFDRLMQRLVVAPLGLSGGFNPAEMSPAQLARIAPLYRKRSGPEGKEAWDPKGPWVAQVDDYSKEPAAPRAGPSYVPGENGTLFGPQGNLRASAADLGRVMRMLADRGRIDGKRFLAPETVDLMLSRQWSREAGGPGASDFGRHRQRFQAWGLGNQHFRDVSGPGLGDRLVEGGGFTAVGHHGDAWGLTGILAFDPRTKDGFVFLTGGPGFDPATTPGAWSSFHRYEERIMTALHRGAIRRGRN